MKWVCICWHCNLTPEPTDQYPASLRNNNSPSTTQSWQSSRRDSHSLKVELGKQSGRFKGSRCCAVCEEILLKAYWEMNGRMWKSWIIFFFRSKKLKRLTKKKLEKRPVGFKLIYVVLAVGRKRESYSKSDTLLIYGCLTDSQSKKKKGIPWTW